MYTKYYYQEKSLKEYCKENGLSYTTIIARIHNIQDKNPAMPIDEVIKKAINSTGNKYNYQEQSLKEYCKENGLSYTTIFARIHNIQNKNPAMSIDEVIESAINYSRKKKCPLYNYNGKSLSEYCDILGIKYNSAYRILERTKEKYGYLSDESLMEIALKLKTIKEVLNENMNQFLNSKGICYTLNVELAQEFLREYISNYFSENNSIKTNTQNKVKKLVYEYKNNNQNQQ